MAVNAIVPTISTFADVLERLGNVPPARIPVHPVPGTATEQDVITARDREKRLFELVDGILVEKPMGYWESRLAAILIVYLQIFIRKNNLGAVAGEGGMLHLGADLIRIPDVSFVSWKKFHAPRVLGKAVPALVPDLAVEVLSESNTAAEMKRKLQEYFDAGAALVWIVEPKDRTVRVHTSPENSISLHENDVLDGGSVLPGFTIPIRDWFDEASSIGPGPIPPGENE
jgi:Uma2 family endonuclease